MPRENKLLLFVPYGHSEETNYGFAPGKQKSSGVMEYHRMTRIVQYILVATC